MMRLLSIIAFTFCIQFANAQAQEVLFVEGGNSDNPYNKVVFSSLDLTTNTVTNFDSLPGQFTGYSIVQDSIFAYMILGTSDSVSSQIRKYNILTKKLVASIKIAGVADMAIFKDKLLISKYYPVSNKAFAIYNSNNLSLVKEFSEIKMECGGMSIANDKAYIAGVGTYPNYTDSGTFYIVNLLTNQFEKTVRLDTNNKKFNKVHVYKNTVFGIGDSLITSYNLTTKNFSHIGFNGKLGYAISMLHTQNNIMISPVDFMIKKFDFNNLSKAPASIMFGFPDAVVFDSVANALYQTYSDFKDTGYIEKFDLTTNQKTSFQTKAFTSALTIFYKVKIQSGIDEMKNVLNLQYTYNKENKSLNLISSAVELNTKIYTMHGEQILKSDKNLIDLSSISNGVYIVYTSAEGKAKSFKLIKE